MHAMYSRSVCLLPLGPGHVYTVSPLPWYGDQTPLTLSLILFTGLLYFLFLSPVESRSSSTLFCIWFACMFLTQTARVLPLM